MDVCSSFSSAGCGILMDPLYLFLFSMLAECILYLPCFCLALSHLLECLVPELSGLALPLPDSSLYADRLCNDMEAPVPDKEAPHVCVYHSSSDVQDLLPELHSQSMSASDFLNANCGCDAPLPLCSHDLPCKHTSRSSLYALGSSEASSRSFEFATSNFASCSVHPCSREPASYVPLEHNCSHLTPPDPLQSCLPSNSAKITAVHTLDLQRSPELFLSSNSFAPHSQTNQKATS